MATTQLLDGTARVCKDTSPTPRTEWQLEVTSNAGVQVVLGLDYPLREFLREVLAEYQDDEPAPTLKPWHELEPEDDYEDGLGDNDHGKDCDCADCEDGV